MEDLTEVLTSGSGDTDDMDEEVGESSDSLPTATTPAGKWLTTSTYDIYMGDTPNDNNIMAEATMTTMAGEAMVAITAGMITWQQRRQSRQQP